MTYRLLSVLLFVLLGCINSAKEKQLVDYVKTEVVLADSLGVVTFDRPLRYDTSFVWIHYSDCNTCHEHKYRSQSKSDPILKETGWLWKHPTDSIDRFTITHKNYYFAAQANDSIMPKTDHAHFRELLLQENPSMQIALDTIMTINDRNFSIVSLTKEGALHHQIVFATASINSTLVNFICEQIARSDDSTTRSFIKNSMTLIESIRIVNGRKYSRERAGVIPPKED